MVEQLIEDWGLWFLLIQALAVAVTAFVPPFPSEIMVIASGAMSADGYMPLWLVLLATFLGCLVGDVGLYLMFRYQFIRVLYRWKWGRRIHRAMVRASIRAGGANTWIGLALIRWIPGGRAASMATAGMMRLSWNALTALALLGAVTWTAWLVGLGYITGTTTGMPPWASTVTAIVIGTVVGLAIAVMVARRRRASTQV
ncbi:DedA family protein [Nesterenkonia flava]|uniref:VTT domain-containing protein n=1 Tax=Nesterenkonia flava TaxID=469799 RepID=A0ABU1FQU3_9MICC|nr:VTT domain-containing protein [Nesterenkonia flava]MDR5711020.1 VTT domain-containing protein [Nesterenkonia flava]